MYIFFSILFFISTISSIILGSQKPSLQYLNTKTISLDQLDTTLNARLWTKVDQLNVALEDVTLTTEQKAALDEINKKQNEIVAECKNLYTVLIKEQMESIKINRASTIRKTIKSYRADVKLKINTQLTHKIMNLLATIPKDNSIKENIPDARRRQRE